MYPFVYPSWMLKGYESISPKTAFRTFRISCSVASGLDKHMSFQTHVHQLSIKYHDCAESYVIIIICHIICPIICHIIWYHMISYNSYDSKDPTALMPHIAAPGEVVDHIKAGDLTAQLCGDVSCTTAILLLELHTVHHIFSNFILLYDIYVYITIVYSIST